MNGKNCRVKGCFSRGAPSFITRNRVKLFEYKLPIFDFDIPRGLDSNMNKNLTTLKNAFSNNYPVYNKIESFSYNNNTPYAVVYLYQKDFDNGTVRITKPGVYVLQENITFNPNKHLDFMPTKQQISSGLYPSDKKAPFHLGFFGAITIESEGVILDLNNKSIQQSALHNIQQRFYSIIEVASSPFVPKQGPSDFIGDEIHKSADKLLIMNGTIGLSSHHGIHGNGAKNLILHNLTIENFEVAGIALNGSKNVIINNVKVQNTFKPIKLLSTYSQARFIKFRLQSMSEDYPDFNDFIFKNKKASEIINHLNSKLDATFAEINKIQDNQNNQDITSKLFKNPEKNEGLDANVYGIVLATRGVVINDFKKERPTGDDTGNEFIFLNNVSISGISSNPKEIIALSNNSNECDVKESYGNDLQTGPIGDVIQILKIKDSNNRYKPNVLSDAQLLFGKYALQHTKGNIKTKITQNFVDWAENGTALTDLIDISGFYYVGGRDSMGHIMKGNIGLFVSAGKNIFGKNITIEPPTTSKSMSDISTNMNNTVYNVYKPICPHTFQEKPYKNLTFVNTTNENTVVIQNNSNNKINHTPI